MTDIDKAIWVDEDEEEWLCRVVPIKSVRFTVPSMPSDFLMQVPIMSTVEAMAEWKGRIITPFMEIKCKYLDSTGSTLAAINNRRFMAILQYSKMNPTVTHISVFLPNNPADNLYTENVYTSASIIEYDESMDSDEEYEDDVENEKPSKNSLDVLKGGPLKIQTRYKGFVHKSILGESRVEAEMCDGEIATSRWFFMNLLGRTFSPDLNSSSRTISLLNGGTDLSYIVLDESSGKIVAHNRRDDVINDNCDQIRDRVNIIFKLIDGRWCKAVDGGEMKPDLIDYMIKKYYTQEVITQLLVEGYCKIISDSFKLPSLSATTVTDMTHKLFFWGDGYYWLTGSPQGLRKLVDSVKVNSKQIKVSCAVLPKKSCGVLPKVANKWLTLKPNMYSGAFWAKCYVSLVKKMIPDCEVKNLNKLAFCMACVNSNSNFTAYNASLSLIEDMLFGGECAFKLDPQHLMEMAKKQWCDNQIKDHILNHITLQLGSSSETRKAMVYKIADTLKDEAF